VLRRFRWYSASPAAPGSSARHPFWCAHAGAAAPDRSTAASALSQSVPRPRCLRRPGRQRLRRRAAPRRDACPRASALPPAACARFTICSRAAVCACQMSRIATPSAFGDADLLDLVPVIPEIVADVPCSRLAPQSPIIEMQTALEAAPVRLAAGLQSAACFSGFQVGVANTSCHRSLRSWPCPTHPKYSCRPLMDKH
jgi:hypothetical protein